MSLEKIVSALGLAVGRPAVVPVGKKGLSLSLGAL